MSSEELAPEVTLMRACWAFFDEVRSRVSAELQQGPRGGGRDRDRIVRHVVGNEQEWARKLGVLTPHGAMLTDDGLKAHRDDFAVPAGNVRAGLVQVDHRVERLTLGAVQACVLHIQFAAGLKEAPR
jgi:hypothetical protein